MYPVLRFFNEFLKFRKAPALPVTGMHVSTHMCWPWDLDPWWELNNGRTLTLYDLGRVPLIHRTGLVELLKREKWGITVAGNSVRYRRRIRAFDRFTMYSRTIGWDGRFFYMEQSMWRKGECTSHMLIRSAVTSKDGIVAPARVMQAAGEPVESPALPVWVQAWIDGDRQRPWPPEIPADAKA